MKTLIVFFSAERRTTAKAAESAAAELGADLWEITPEKPYTAADLKWTNPAARCNREKFGKKEVPVMGRIPDFEAYDTVLIGFPIWYGCAPNVVNTFCAGYDWTGKRVTVFATSGGSGIGKTEQKIAPFLPGARLLGAKLVRSGSELSAWAKNLL